MFPNILDKYRKLKKRKKKQLKKNQFANMQRNCMVTSKGEVVKPQPIKLFYFGAWFIILPYNSIHSTIFRMSFPTSFRHFGEVFKQK